MYVEAQSTLGRLRPHNFPKSGRFLVVLLIALDTFRRMLFRDARPIDTAMLVVEILILLLILAEFVWRMVEWRVDRRDARQREKVLKRSLDALGDSLADSLRDFVLLDRQLDNNTGVMLSKKQGIVEATFTGWKLPEENRRFLRKWAKKRRIQPCLKLSPKGVTVVKNL